MGSKAKILLQIILLSICLFAQSDVDGPLYIVGSDPKLYVPKTPSAASVPDSFLVKLPDNSIGTYPLSFTRTMISGFWAGPFWDSIPDKPSSFTPKLHHHDSLYYRKSEVTTIVNGKEPAISTSTSDKFWNGLKQWVNITIGNVLGLNDTITNHRTAIASKLNISDTSSLARKNHGHSQSQITGLVDTVTAHRNAINNKQPLDTDLTTIAGLTHSNRHVLISDGSTWTRRALVEADIPSLSISKTTGLQTALDGKAALVHNHNRLYGIVDTRAVATTTDDYDLSVIPQFKSNTAIGLTAGGTYSTTLGLFGWNDASGGYAHELAFNSLGIYSRMGAPGSPWGVWRRLLTTADVDPLNYVTLSTDQTITGEKTFTSNLIMNGLDNENVLISKNISASNENQFYIKHDYGSTHIGNYRGGLVIQAGGSNGAIYMSPRAYFGTRPENNHRWNLALDNYNTFYGFGSGMNVMHNLYYDGTNWRYRYGEGSSSGGVVAGLAYNGFSIATAPNGLKDNIATLNTAIYTNLSGNTAFGKSTFVGGYRVEVEGDAFINGDLLLNAITAYGYLNLRNNIRLLNKAGTGWVDFITRNVSGSEAGAEIENVKSVNGYVIEDGSGKIYREAHPDDYLQLFTNGTGLFSSSSMVLNANYGESPIQLNCSRVKMGRRNVGEWTTINIGSGLTEIDIENYPGVQRFKFEVNGIDAKVLFKNAEAGDEIFVMNDGYGNPQIAHGNSGDDWTFILGQYIHLTCEGNASLKIGAGWYTGNTWIQW